GRGDVVLKAAGRPRDEGTWRRRVEAEEWLDDRRFDRLGERVAESAAGGGAPLRGPCPRPPRGPDPPPPPPPPGPRGPWGVRAGGGSAATRVAIVRASSPGKARLPEMASYIVTASEN